MAGRSCPTSACSSSSAAALTRGPQFAAVLGFVAGVALDLAPPADHVAGRWALALVVVGYVAGRVRQDVKPTAVAVVATVAASSFVGTSVFALTGLLLRDPVLDVRRAAAGDPGRGALGRAAHAVRAAAGDDACSTGSSPSGRRPDGVDRLSTADGEASAVAAQGRLRLIVIQALVFSLFATLFARLYYLQVVSGDEYHAQAASQSVREIVVQPQRGLIVDDQGRPLVANRPSWVVSVDRTLLGKMSEAGSAAGCSRGSAGAVDARRPRGSDKRLVTCGDAGSVAGTCWNGSPYQPVPVAARRPRSRSPCGSSSSPRTTRRCSPSSRACAPTRARYGINLAHVLGYLSPITEDEYDAARADGDRSVNGASSVGRAGVEKQYDEWLRGMPGYRSVAVDSMGRVLGDDSELAGQPGDTLVTSIDAKVQGVVERQLAQTIATARRDPRRRSPAATTPPTPAPPWSWRPTPAGSSRWPASRRTTPSVWVGGISEKQLRRLYSDARPAPRC